MCLVVLACGLVCGLACGEKHGYLKIIVSQGPFLGQVYQYAASAYDGAADGGPTLVPPARGQPLADATSFLVTLPLGATATVAVVALGQDGGVLAAATSGPEISSAGGTSVALTLGPLCRSDRDCDPMQVCAGALGCGSGACEPAGAPSDLAAGTPCGPSDAGHCDGQGTCLLGTCGTGARPLAAGEQCDDGASNSDTLPNRCRTDCQLPHCGDGVVDDGEVCDDGLGNGQGSGCNATCSLHGVVATVAGDGDAGTSAGTGRSASFGGPFGLAELSGSLYVADSSSLGNAVRRVNLRTLAVSTLAGGAGQLGGGCPDSYGLDASFCGLWALDATDAGGMYETGGATLNFVDLDGEVTWLAGQLSPNRLAPPVQPSTGALTQALFGDSRGIALAQGVIFTDPLQGASILATDLTLGRVTAEYTFNPGAGLLGQMLALNGMLYLAAAEIGGIVSLDLASGVEQTAVPGLQAPDGVCSDGSSLYICESGASRLVQFELDAGTLSVVAGTPGGGEADGTGTAALFNHPANCLYDAQGGPDGGAALFVTDYTGKTLREIY